MRTNYVVGGYVCLMVLAVFTDNREFLPGWVSGSLWIILAFCFTKLAFPSETGLLLKARKPREAYLNSPKPATKRGAFTSTERSHNFCRVLYEGVKAWKRENPFSSWDHPEAIEVFNEFSEALDKHLEEFPSEARDYEVSQWVAYANEIRRNRD